MTAKKDELPPYHELFELPEGESPKDFPPPTNLNAVKVWIVRYGGPNGIEKCPRPYLLAEIPDMLSFHNMFGGGRYQVEGRYTGEGKTGQFYARRDFVLSGDPKPLIMSDPSAPQTAAPSAAASGGSSGFSFGGDGMAQALQAKDPMSLIILMMMKDAERAEARAERQAQLQAQQAQAQSTMAIENMKLIATVLGGQRAGTDPAVASAFANMTDLVKTQLAVTHAPAPAQPQRSVEEEMKRAQDLLSLAKKMAPTESTEKFTDIVKELLQIVPPELAQSVAASLMGGNGAAARAPAQIVEGVVGPVG